MSRTLGQQRAAYCLERLKNIKCKREDFKPLSASLPAMILQNGFGQTLAFLVAKGSKTDKNTRQIILQDNDKHIVAFHIIVGWLVNRKILEANGPSDLLMKVSHLDQTKYLQAQRETLAMLEWLKRYANAGLFEETTS